MILSSTEPDNGGLYISNSSHTSISQPRDFNLSLNTAGSELAELEAVEPGALLSLGLISFPRLDSLILSPPGLTSCSQSWDGVDV